MKKIAIVVQRCHESVRRGSESSGVAICNSAQRRLRVDVLTTTATDAAYWTNVLPLA